MSYFCFFNSLAHSFAKFSTSFFSFFFFSAKIKNTELVQEQGFPPRLVIQSEDGTIRIASGSTGETLTTHLPLIESEKIKNVAYSRSIDRLFVLTHHQEIYVVDTTINPCIIVDIWKAGERSKNSLFVSSHDNTSARY